MKEDFLPFNIDITTDESRYLNAAVGSRMRVIITPTNAASPGSGGVAYLDSYRRAGTVLYSATIPAWVFNSTPSDIAEAVSHEAGHTFGLRHDGDLSKPVGTVAREYYSGHNNWGPIMGTPYAKAVTQWSKGEYANASNTEDDLGILAGHAPTSFSGAANNFGYVVDEDGGSRGTAAVLGTVVTSNVNRTGVITHPNDQDFYQFTLTQPQAVSVNAAAATVAPNLNIFVELQDSSGNVLGSRNNPSALGASLEAKTLAAGIYYVRIRGADEAGGFAGGLGYSSYGSTGHYRLDLNQSTPPTVRGPDNHGPADSPDGERRVYGHLRSYCHRQPGPAVSMAKERSEP